MWIEATIKMCWLGILRWRIGLLHTFNSNAGFLFSNILRDETKAKSD